MFCCLSNFDLTFEIHDFGNNQNQLTALDCQTVGCYSQ